MLIFETKVLFSDYVCFSLLHLAQAVYFGYLGGALNCTDFS